MNTLANRRLLLVVTGGIAAYKSADLVRRLREAGAEVRVVMTRAATRFVAPLTFQALSGNPVRVELFDPEAEAGMDHIALARWAEAVVVAPASADFMARLAHGLGDDLAATLCLATRAPLLIAPAMNSAMWEHGATRANHTTLAARGVRFTGPASGDLACGEQGAGRMVEPGQLVEELTHLFAAATALAGVRVLITAGPTREPLDPVRFLGNRSSGRMGYAVAGACAEAGAHVTLVSGPVALPPPPGVMHIGVESAAQMHAEVMARAGEAELFIATAAVADYRPAQPAQGKIKKEAEELTVTLLRNPDILAEVAALEGGPFTVGFAAETDDVERYAGEKLRRKGLDMIAANRVGGAEGGFESDRNALTVLWEGGREELPMEEKGALARRLVALISRRLAETHP